MENKDKLASYFRVTKTTGQLPFSTNELSEPLITSFKMIGNMIRDDGDYLEVLSDRIVAKKNAVQQIIWEFKTQADFAPYFEFIFHKDDFINQLMSIEKRADHTKISIR